MIQLFRDVWNTFNGSKSVEDLRGIGLHLTNLVIPSSSLTPVSKSKLNFFGVKMTEANHQTISPPKLPPSSLPGPSAVNKFISSMIPSPEKNNHTLKDSFKGSSSSSGGTLTVIDGATNAIITTLILAAGKDMGGDRCQPQHQPHLCNESLGRSALRTRWLNE